MIPVSEFESNDVPEVDFDAVPEVELEDLGEEEEVVEDSVEYVVIEDDAE